MVLALQRVIYVQVSLQSLLTSMLGYLGKVFRLLEEAAWDRYYQKTNREKVSELTGRLCFDTAFDCGHRYRNRKCD